MIEEQLQWLASNFGKTAIFGYKPDYIIKEDITTRWYQDNDSIVIVGTNKKYYKTRPGDQGIVSIKGNQLLFKHMEDEHIRLHLIVPIDQEVKNIDIDTPIPTEPRIISNKIVQRSNHFSKLEPHALTTVIKNLDQIQNKLDKLLGKSNCDITSSSDTPILFKSKSSGITFYMDDLPNDILALPEFEAYLDGYRIEKVIRGGIWEVELPMGVFTPKEFQLFLKGLN